MIEQQESWQNMLQRQQWVEFLQSFLRVLQRTVKSILNDSVVDFKSLST